MTARSAAPSPPLLASLDALGAAFTPSQIITTVFLVPYLIVLLSFFPSTRWLRIAIWPVGVTALYLSAGILNEPIMDVRVLHWGLAANLSAGPRYAFKPDAPIFHPLPRRPLLAPLRNLLPIRAWDIFTGEQRMINTAPEPPLKRGRGYLSSLWHNFYLGFVYLLLFDGFHIIVARLAPDTFGGCYMTHADFVPWVQDLGKQAGLPWAWPIIWTAFAWGYMIDNVAGMAMPYHFMAVIFIGIGYNIGEEWPDMHDGWWKATSLNEFWGTRYHQTMRRMLLLWAKPFENAPRPIHILAVFAGSTIAHYIIFYAIDHTVMVWPVTLFFMGQGVGCILERHLLKHHGIRVGGLRGRLWCFVWGTLTAIPLVNAQYGSGWIGYARRDFTLQPQNSPVEWALYALGFPSVLAKGGN